MAIILGLLGIFLVVSVIGGGYNIMVLVFSPDRPIDGYFMKIAAYVLDRLGFLGAFLPFFAVMYVITFIVAASFLDYDSDKDHEEMGEIMGIPLGAVIIGSFEYFAFANFLIDTPFGAFTSGAAGAWVFSNASTTHQWIAAVVCTICLPGSMLFMLFKMFRVSGVLRKTLFLFWDICDFIKEKLPKNRKQLEHEAAMRKAEEERRFQEELKEQLRIAEEMRKEEEKENWFRAVEKEDAEAVQRMIREGVNVNTRDDSDGRTALMYAAQYNKKTKIINLLIKAKADVNAQDLNEMTALMYAAQKNHNPAVIYALVKAGAEVNKRNLKLDGYTALLFAVTDNRDSVIRALLKSKADIHLHTLYYHETVADVYTEHNGWAEFSPLIEKKLIKEEKEFIEICKNGKEKDIIKQLEQGVDVNISDEEGLTPLMFVLQRMNNKETVKQMLEAEADVNAADKKGNTPLILWANVRFKKDPEGELEILQSLLDAGATANAANNNGDTALMTLAELSRFKRPIEFTKKAIKALLDAGADPLKENKKGKSALSIAEKAGNTDIIKMLSK